MTKTSANIHLISDSTGETVQTIARACLAQFPSLDVREYHYSFIRVPAQIDAVLENITRKPGPVFNTLVREDLKSRLETGCSALNIPVLSVLDPLFYALGKYYSLSATHYPGRQHALNDEYFRRIEAVEFAIAHDDGQCYWELEKAEIVLLGVSRTSKTPTCLYLANKGYYVANIPYVFGSQVLDVVHELQKPFLVGLTNDPVHLQNIRRARLLAAGADLEVEAYVDLATIRREIAEAKRFFHDLKCPVIDVSKRSIEETAAEIIVLYEKAREES